MKIPLNRVAGIVFYLGFLAFLYCTPNPIYRQYHTSDNGKSSLKPARKAAPKQNVSVAVAAQKEDLPESDAPRSDASQGNARRSDKWDIDNNEKTAPLQAVDYNGKAWYADGDHFHVPTTRVRIMLRQNATQTRIESSGSLTVSGVAGRMALHGAATIERGASPGRARYVVEGGENGDVALPCTLYSGSEFNIVTIDGAAYRGSVIIAPDGPVFSIVNYVDVENYLRGVVPLEVGRGSDDVVEAVKAQAVAARTYTYRKMMDNAGSAFDCSATVSDQVYGGVAKESEVCNRAIHATDGEVMVHHDSLIYAYYHSTCGGRTANIEDVWNKSAVAYLRSVDDGDGPYCSQSGSFTWEETWPLPQFSFIVNKYSREAFPQNPCRGDMRDISIRSKFRCGRARELCIRTSEGEFLYGGDKVRSVLRRNTAGFPILKSSLITDVSVRGGSVVIRGRGYGHGVGLCQMGALGRARNGKEYKDIVKAYYTGIEIKKISVNK